jgi:cytochrome c oxidase assembly protein subunit 15
MFISTHNYWFSRVALLSSIFVLSGIVLGTYTQLLPADNFLKIRVDSFQIYIIHSISLLILFLTAAALYLHRELSYKPFVISLGLLLLAASQYYVDQLSSYLHLATNTVFTEMLIKLCMLSLFWWITVITGPLDHALVNENNKKYRLWAWLGFLLLFSQMLLSVWLSTSHADLVCTDFPYCNGQLFPELDFYALTTLPLTDAGLITLHMLYRICTIVTTLYLTIFSISFIFNRALGEMGILIFLFMLTQITLGIIEWILQKSFWVSFSHSIVSVFALLAIISLLIALYRKYITSYY